MWHDGESYESHINMKVKKPSQKKNYREQVDGAM